MKSRVEIKSSDRRLMGVVIPALSDNGFVNITLAMKVLSDDRPVSYTHLDVYKRQPPTKPTHPTDRIANI